MLGALSGLTGGSPSGSSQDPGERSKWEINLGPLSFGSKGQRKRRVTLRRSDLSDRASEEAEEAKKAEETKKAKGEITKGTPS